MVKKTATSSAKTKPSLRKRTTKVNNIDNTQRRTKQPISLRLDADVVDWFRDAGGKYQTRINDVLRDYVKRQSKLKE